MSSPFGAEFHPLDKANIQYVVPLRGEGETKGPGGFDGTWPTRWQERAKDVRNAFVGDTIIQKLYPPATTGAPATGSGQIPYMLKLYRHEDTGGGTTDRLLCIMSGGGANTLWEYVFPTWTSRGAGWATAFADGVQYGNRFFIVNGTDRKVWDSSTLQNVLQANPNALTMNADPEDVDASGHLLAGAIYSFSYSFYSSTTGDETQMAPATNSTLKVFTGAAGDNVFKIDIPAYTPAARFDKIRIYRTTANGALFYLDSTVTWNTAGLTDLPVGITFDSSLVIGHVNDNADMPLARGLIVWDDRLWCFGMVASSHTMAFSKAGQPASFPVGNTVVLDRYDGMPITAACVYDGRMYVFNEERAYIIQPGSSTTYQAKRLEGHPGVIEHGAVSSAYGAIFGASRQSLWKSNGYNAISMSAQYHRRIASMSGTPFTSPIDMIPWTADGRHLLVMGSYATGQKLLFTQDGEIATLYGTGASGDTESFLRVCAATNGAISGGSPGGGAPEILVSADTVGSTVAVRYRIASNYSATAQSSYWESCDIDVDPEVPHKNFYFIDVYQGCSPGSVASGGVIWSVYYDGENSIVAETDVLTTPAAVSTVGQTMTRTRILLANGVSKETIRIKFDTGVYKTMLDIRKVVVFWKASVDVGNSG